MDVTVAHLADVVEDIALITFEDIEVRPDLPVNLSPGDSVSFSYKGHKLLKIPSSVHNMLSSDLAVTVYESFGLGALENLSLAVSEQLVAISTLVQVVVLFLE